jgi:hypothetical protein
VPRNARYRRSDRRIAVRGAATDIELGSDDNLYARIADVRDVSIASLARAAAELRGDMAEDVTTLYFSDVPADRFFPDHIPVSATSLKFFNDQVRVMVDTENPALHSAPPIRELFPVLRTLLRRHGAHLGATHSGDAIAGGLSLGVAVNYPRLRRTASDVLAFGRDAKLLLDAALGSGGALDPGVVADLIRGGRADLLVGQRESAWLEAKAQPYGLPAEEERFELAKDVASLANADGGLILIGAKRRTDRNGDRLGPVTEIPLELFNTRSYRDTIRKWIYPRPEKVTTEVIAGSRSTHGLMLIEIPRQPEELKPFLVMGSVLSRRHRSDVHLTVPVRDGEDTAHYDAGRIHALLSAGRAALSSASTESV